MKRFQNTPHPPCNFHKTIYTSQNRKAPLVFLNRIAKKISVKNLKLPYPPMKDTTPRKTAKDLGLKYYEGRECLHGHGTKRDVAHGECVACRSEAKAKAAKRKREERGPVRLGRKPTVVGPPKPVKSKISKPITEFDYWVRRNRSKCGPKRRKQRRSIPINHYQTLFVTHCPLLGIELSYKLPQKSLLDNYATLDRIDSSKGYTVDNVQIISYRANTIKNNATLEEMQLIAKNWAAQIGQ
jgi:hypothetical protein